MPATEDQRDITTTKSVKRSSLKAFAITFLIYGTLSSLYCWGIHDDVIRGGRDAYQLWIGLAIFSLPSSLAGPVIGDWIISLADERTTHLAFWVYSAMLTVAGSVQYGLIVALIVAFMRWLNIRRATKTLVND